MRLSLVSIAGLTALVAATPASAATIVIFTDPMTLERTTVVVDPDGPDRAYMCMMPPAVSACQAVPLRRQRR